MQASWYYEDVQCYINLNPKSERINFIRNVILNRILVFILIFTSTVAAEVDRIFLVQDRLYSAALKSLANAGIALPTDLFNGLTNPALTFSHYHTVVPQSNGTAAIGYGQDSIFNAHIFPAGLSYSNQEGSIGLFYRFMKGKMDILQHEMIINFASQIFPNPMIRVQLTLA
jgi:hypothetical protein